MLRFAVLALTLFPTFGHAMPEGRFSAVRDLLENRDGFFTQGTFLGAELAKISFTKFGSSAGAQGCLVVSPGQGESAMKYVEVAYDLQQKGFSPIYVIDHRGQGASDRILPDEPQKNSVRKFAHYADDFAVFLEAVVLKDAACRGHKMGLLAHSMGGAIAAAYLEKAGASSPFEKVAMSAPMMKIAFPAGKTENSVLTETFVACLAPVLPGKHCDDYAPGKGPYDAGAPFAGNVYTHSEARFGLKATVFAKWPNLVVGGPTIRWVRQSALADKDLRQSWNAQRVASKVLILQAAKDAIVDNEGQNEFCANARSCKIEKIAGAYHELLMETDSIRDQVLDLVTRFLGN